MTKEIARNAIVFLQRVDLKGGEAPAFMAVLQALEWFVMQPEAAADADLSGTADAPR